MKNKAAAVILNFFLRAVMGICLIYFVNQYVLPDQDSWKVGINGLSFLTSGSLGIPGVCMLYGILVYQSKVFTKNCNLGKAYGQGGKLRL